jgi:hypothetical protein
MNDNESILQSVIKGEEVLRKTDGGSGILR